MVQDVLIAAMIGLLGSVLIDSTTSGASNSIHWPKVGLITVKPRVLARGVGEWGFHGSESVVCLGQ